MRSAAGCGVHRQGIDEVDGEVEQRKCQPPWHAWVPLEKPSGAGGRPCRPGGFLEAADFAKCGREICLVRCGRGKKLRQARVVLERLFMAVLVLQAQCQQEREAFVVR